MQFFSIDSDILCSGFANNKSVPEPSLRSQDILVLAKLLAYAGPRPAMATMAGALSISSSEVHGALGRLARARLISAEGSRPLTANIEEFLLHGIKYMFPVSRGGPAVGLVTAHAALAQASGAASRSGAAPASDAGNADVPSVWPFEGGNDRGLALEPIYRTAPAAALRDPALYELLAVIDVLRDPDRKTGAVDMSAVFRDRP